MLHLLSFLLFINKVIVNEVLNLLVKILIDYVILYSYVQVNRQRINNF